MISKEIQLPTCCYDLEASQSPQANSFFFLIPHGKQVRTLYMASSRDDSNYFVNMNDTVYPTELTAILYFYYYK